MSFSDERYDSLVPAAQALVDRTTPAAPALDPALGIPGSPARDAALPGVRPGTFAEAPFAPVNAAPRPMLNMSVDPRVGAPRMSGGGAPVNRDPFNINGLQATADQATRATYAGLDSMGQQERLVGDLTAEREGRTADLREGNADARLGREGDVQRENEEMQAQVQDWVDQSAKLNDQISQEKVDPAHFFADKSIGDQFVMGLGGILGGLLSVQPGQDGKNHFLEQMNSMVERDIRSQEQSIANKRASLSQRDNLLGQYMKVHGDKTLAKLQMSDRIYQTAQETMEAEAQRNTNPIVRARAEQAAQVFGQQRLERQKAAADGAVALAQNRAAHAAAQRAAAAAAQARAAKAAEQQQYDRGIKERELQIKEREAGNKDDGFVPRKFIAETDAKVAESEGILNPLVQQMQKLDKDGKPMVDAQGRPVIDPERSLPGVGRMSDAVDSSLFRSPLTGKNLFISDQGEVNRTALKQMALQYKNLRTGSGGSDAEAAQIAESFYGAMSQADVAAVIQRAQQFNQALKSTSRAAAGPRVTEQYESNLGGLGAGQMPGSLKRDP